MTYENKTRLSVGCVLYDTRFIKYFVEKITPLSDKFIQVDVFNDFNGTRTCVMCNTKNASLACELPEEDSPWRDYTPLYLHKQTVQKVKERTADDEFCQIIGGVVIKLSEMIKEKEATMDANGEQCNKK